MVSTKTNIIQGGVLEFAPFCDDQQICMEGIIQQLKQSVHMHIMAIPNVEF